MMVKQLDEVKTLPTLPHILLRLMEICSRDDALISDVAAIVEQDPSLSAKILSMVNSPLYGLPNHVSTVGHAVKLLGIDTVKNIAICASVHGIFSRNKHMRNVNLSQFWTHSLKVATLSRKVAQEVSYASPEEAFLAGLLHDIGRLVLVDVFPEEYTSIFDSDEEDPHALLEKEASWGITHAEAGAYIISRWNLPSLLADCSRYHHEPVEDVRTAFPLVKIVYAAHSIAGSGNAEEARSLLNIHATQVALMREESKGEVHAAAKALDISIDEPEENEKTASQPAFENLQNAVKNLSLLLGTFSRIMTREDEASVYLSLMEGLNVVFGLEDTLCFSYEKNTQLLKAVKFRSMVDSLEGLSLSGADGKSLPAVSLETGEIRSSFDCDPRSFSILDKQLLSLSGKEGFICIPLIFRKARLGMVLCFVSRERASGFSEDRPGVELLARESAHVLYSESIRKARADFVLAQRMEAQTLLARKIVHEANNPLSIIRNYLKMMESKLKGTDIEGLSFPVINEELDRIARLLRGFVDFSFPRTVSPEATDIHKTLRDIVHFVQGAYAQKGVSVHIEEDKTIPLITLRKDSFKQIMINLLKNAFEAVPTGGEIRIRTALSSHWVEIYIYNNGEPIPEQIRDHIFEPLVSTKGKGHEGLGLSIVYNLAREMGGSVRLADSPSKETCFVLQLPL